MDMATTTEASVALKSAESEKGPPEEPAAGLRRRKFVECAQDTLEQASELLKLKIPCVGHILAPKRLWLKRISTPNCDVVVVFPPNTQDAVLLWLLGRLRQASGGGGGLSVHVRHHTSTQSSAFYLTAHFQILLRAAEEYHLPKALKSTKGGGLKEFGYQDLQSFEGADSEDSFFTSQERQWLVLRLLESIRAKTSDTKAVPGIELLEGQPIVPKCLTAGVISQVFPLHEPSSVEKLQIGWVRDVSSKQPLDDIAEYFGVKIAMYFAWLGHYTTALGIPGIVGFMFWLCCNGKNQNLEDLGYVLFSVFNIVWVTSYTQAWKRYSAELAFRWGTLDQRNDLLAEPRPLFRKSRDSDRRNLFQGPLEPSPVTGRLEPWQPAWRRYAYRYFVTVPIIAVCLCAVFFVMIVSLRIQDWWDYHLEHRGYPLWLGYLPKILLAIVITLMDEAYFKIAIWLNDNENYRLETKYENHLIGKVALFQFINSFLSLFYIAFYLQDQARLKEQLAALFISRQVIGNLKESAVPYVLEHMRLAKMSFDMWGALSPTTGKSTAIAGDAASETTAEVAEKDKDKDGNGDSAEKTVKRSMNQAEVEASLYKYDGTFSEHLEMTIQLGYVILFSSAFPPAAICALFNNMIEIRSDAFKLAYVCQRPFGQRVPNIGTWQQCMEYISIVAVLVNCALIGLSGIVHRMFPDITATQTILLIVALEHIMLCLRFAITCAIPDIPGWLATEMAKIEWARREASRVSNTATPSPEDLCSKLIGSHSLVGGATTAASGSGESPPPRSTMGRTLGLLDDPQHSAARPSSGSSKRGSAASITSAGTPTSPGGNANVGPAAKINMGSIQLIPPFKPRKSKEWVLPEGETSHHLTIGPSGGAEWAKRITGEHPSTSAASAGSADIHRSTDCITPSKTSGGASAVSATAEASSSDSDLLRASPVWPPRPREVKPDGGAGSVISAAVAKARANSASLAPPISSAVTPGATEGAISSETDEQAAARAAEELAAKKTRVKQSLMKRARSVAIFSLKLKERRAREAAEKGAAGKLAVTPTTPALPPPQCGGGELSCIPIEMLIQLEDLRQTPQQRSGSTS